MTTTPDVSAASAPVRVLDVELLALDLSTCTRCTGSLAHLETAVEAVRQVAEWTGVELRVRKIRIDSEQEALRHRFTSSPTIRVAGRDIALETLESRCESCTELCGCAEGTSCRVWRYRGAEHDQAPIGLVVEALLREIVGAAPAAPAPQPENALELPENLRRFFAGRAALAAAAPAGCCPPAERATCCAPEEKASCCSDTGSDCGCR